MNIFYSFLLTLIAGLSTMMGSIFIFLKPKSKIINKSLSFAAGVMITVSIIDLLPEAFILLHSELNLFLSIIYISIFIIINLIISMFIDKYVPTNDSLYKIGIVSMLAIIMHNIPEGIATFMASNKSINLGIKICIAIALHNIPEGISISIPIYYATKSRVKAILYTFISGISEPIGAFLAYLFLGPYINNKIMSYILCIIIGIMIQIPMYELLPEALKYKNKAITIVWMLIGIVVMLISSILL